MEPKPPSGIDSPHSSHCYTIMSAWLVIISLVGCQPAESAAPSTEIIPQVTVTPVVAREIIDYKEFTGTLQASETVKVQSRVYGYLLDILFDDGDYVEKDQELFKIEPDEYRAIHNQSLSRIAIVEAQLELATAKHARNATLVKSQAVSKEEYEESAAAVKEAEASLIAAKADAERSALDLKYTTVISPISGRIDRTLVTRGNFVTGGASATGGTFLTTIVKEHPVFVYFDVDEATLLRYKRISRADDPSANERPGSLSGLKIPCYIQLADEKGYPHKGVLDFASNRSDAGTGTITIRGVFSNEDRLLSSGLFVQVRVPMGKPYQAMLIPEQAIAFDQDQKYVFVVGSDNLAVRKDIELGERQGKLRIVTSGLADGDRVVTKGMQRVRAGKPVDAELAPAPTLPVEEVKEKKPGAAETEAKTPPTPGPSESAESPASNTQSPAPPATSEEK